MLLQNLVLNIVSDNANLILAINYVPAIFVANIFLYYNESK